MTVGPIPDVDTALKVQAILNRIFDTDTNSLKISSLTSMVNVSYDSVYETEPTTTTEVYTYKKDGATVGTVTVTYFDTTKARMTSVVLS